MHFFIQKSQGFDHTFNQQCRKKKLLAGGEEACTPAACNRAANAWAVNWRCARRLEPAHQRLSVRRGQKEYAYRRNRHDRGTRRAQAHDGVH